MKATHVLVCSAMLLAMTCGITIGENAWRWPLDKRRASRDEPQKVGQLVGRENVLLRFPLEKQQERHGVAVADIPQPATDIAYPKTGAQPVNVATLHAVVTSDLNLSPVRQRQERSRQERSRQFAQVAFEEGDEAELKAKDGLGLPTIPEGAWAPEPTPRSAVFDKPLELIPPDVGTEELPIPRGVPQGPALPKQLRTELSTAPRLSPDLKPVVTPVAEPEPKADKVRFKTFFTQREINELSETAANDSENDSENAVVDPQAGDIADLDKSSDANEAAIDLPLTLPNDETLDTEEQSASKPYKTGEELAQELLLQSARNAVRLQQDELAIERFTKYVRRFPDDHDARIEFANVLANAGRREAASAQIEHLHRQFPNDIPFLRRYADMQLQMSNFTRAEVALLRLIGHPEYRIDAGVDLARVYAWTNRTEEALRVYQEVLHGVALDDAKRRLQFAELLVDIQRPHEALELLLSLHEQSPMDLHVVKLLLLANARSGNPQGTLEFIARLDGIEPENVEIRFEVAQIFFQEGFYRESLLVDQQVLQFDPTNLTSLIRSALSNLRLYEVQNAKSMLDTIANSDRLDGNTESKYFRVLAEYHSVVGEHADAIAVCRRVLADTPDDLETRLTLAHAYNRSGQFLRAINDFSRVAEAASQPGVPDGRDLRFKAQLAQALCLAESRRFEEAMALLDLATSENADSTGKKSALLDTYVDVMTKARRFPEAIDAVRAALSEAMGRVNREVALRSKLGLLLYRKGDFASAVQELAAVQNLTDEPTPEVIYGTYQAQRKLGNQTVAESVLGNTFGVFSSDTYLRMRISELANEDCDCCLSRQMLQRLDGLCATNPLVSNRLGEACMQCAACEETCDCAQYFSNTLIASPSNVQAMLGLARANARIGSYEQAQAQYQMASRHVPDDPNIMRELARLMREWKGPEVATEYYDQALRMTDGEHLFASAQATPERTAELEHEYLSLAQMSSIVATEREGKQVTGWRPLTSITTFEGETVLEPHNQDAIFEIGQAFSQLNRTFCAIEQYERLLCINPCHREAQIALARNRLELRPQLHLFSKYRAQAGRSELAEIDTFEAGALLQFPIGDEDEFIQIGYKNARYMPPNRRTAIGDIALARVQWKPVWPLMLFGHFNYETFDYGFEPRLNFDAGFRYRYLEDAELRVVGHQENLVQNGVALARDIHRYGIEIGQQWQPTSRMELDFYYRYWKFSDVNESNEAGIHSGYRLTYGRHRFRWLTDFDYSNHREVTEFDPSGRLEFAIHPYFSPRHFWYVSGGLEYRRYLRCDTYKGANLHWFELYGGGRLDSSGNGYGLARGEFVNDFANWMTLTGYFNVVHATVYRATEVGIQLTIRF